ncbi:putative WRKY transcription factor 33 protein [Corchorus capsularis]|uniref:Putative WRKY transcription factor 33 protein n=1 Tax=Corchorus capsularis TaxID=210143 RepID=A0A1R3H525_COCAP|nr:putative WRKY transcription factor 33 protein [Corchorus capsularis]
MSANSHPQNAFSLSTHPFMTTSLSNLLASGIADNDNPSSAANGGLSSERGDGLSLRRSGSSRPLYLGN